MSEQKGIKEGPPIWVESTMNLQEWKTHLKQYPNTSNLKEPPQFFKSDYEWRHRMGQCPTDEQIRNRNGNIDYLLKHNVKT